MGNLIVVAILLAVVFGAVAKVVIEKRKGAKCIGCPYSKADGSKGYGCSCSQK